jgi:hypothetical protein
MHVYLQLLKAWNRNRTSDLHCYEHGVVQVLRLTVDGAVGGANATSFILQHHSIVRPLLFVAMSLLMPEVDSSPR